MGFFDFGEAKENRDQAYGEHEAKLSHEAIGAGVAFEAMHQWEKKQRESGQPVEHAKAKEFLAAIAGFEVDRLAETKGMDFVEKEKIKHHAKQQSEQMYESQYGDMDQYDPNARGAHDQFGL